jgi:hypothetical protein
MVEQRDILVIYRWARVLKSSTGLSWYEAEAIVDELPSRLLRQPLSAPAHDSALVDAKDGEADPREGLSDWLWQVTFGTLDT